MEKHRQNDAEQAPNRNTGVYLYMTLESKPALGIPSQGLGWEVFKGWVLLHNNVGPWFIQTYLQAQVHASKGAVPSIPACS